MRQSTTAKTLKTAASLKSSSDVLEVVHKTQVEVREDLQKTQEKLLKAVQQTQVHVSDADVLSVLRRALGMRAVCVAIPLLWRLEHC